VYIDIYSPPCQVPGSAGLGGRNPRCRRISNPPSQGGPARLSPAWQGGITNPASARGSRPTTGGSGPSRFSRCRTLSLPPDFQSCGPGRSRTTQPGVARRDYKSRLSNRVPPQHRTFWAQRVLPPPDSLAAAGFPIRRARAVPHDSARRGKAGLQIPPQPEGPAPAQEVLGRAGSPAAGFPIRRARAATQDLHPGVAKEKGLPCAFGTAPTINRWV